MSSQPRPFQSEVDADSLRVTPDPVENDAMQAAWSALGFSEPVDDAEIALFVAGWHAGRSWERRRVHQDAVERSRLTSREDDRGEGAL